MDPELAKALAQTGVLGAILYFTLREVMRILRSIQRKLERIEVFLGVDEPAAVPRPIDREPTAPIHRIRVRTAPRGIPLPARRRTHADTEQDDK